MPQNSESGHLGKDLAEQLQTLAGEVRRNARHAGDIASRSSEASDEAQTYVIRTSGHDNWNFAGGTPSVDSGGGAACDDHGDITADQFLSQGRQLLESSAGVARFESDVLALDIAQFAKLLPEGRPPLQALASVQQLDDRNLGPGLRARVARKRQLQTEAENAEKCLPSRHLISVRIRETELSAGEDSRRKLPI